MIDQLVEAISAKNPVQGRSIKLFMASQDGSYWKFAEDLAERIYALSDGFNVGANAYNRLCSELLGEQIRYARTGKYLLQDAQQANEHVYSQGTMRDYVLALMLSYLFWPNHYQMFRFYQDYIAKMRPQRVLEIGAGHGLFSAEMCRQIPSLELDIIDISQESILLCGEVLGAFGINSGVQFLQEDFLQSNRTGYDFLIMGEIIEHVDNAPLFLSKAYASLGYNGSAYLSTCANCPAVDHIWHFHSVDEIRAMIYDAGFYIHKDMALPVASFPASINYCAILERP